VKFEAKNDHCFAAKINLFSGILQSVEKVQGNLTHTPVSKKLCSYSLPGYFTHFMQASGIDFINMKTKQKYRKRINFS
jgi:hypothetical protein